MVLCIAQQKVDKAGLEPTRPRLQRGALPLELFVLVLLVGKGFHLHRSRTNEPLFCLSYTTSNAGKEGIEPPTSCLTGNRSTTELLPQTDQLFEIFVGMIGPD
jgi:hypothetical protein